MTVTDEDIERIQRIITRRVTEASEHGLKVETLIATLLHDGVANGEMDIRAALMSMGVASAKTGVCISDSQLVFIAAR